MGGGGAGIKWSKSKRSSRKNTVKLIKNRRKDTKRRAKLLKASKDPSVSRRFERKDGGIPNLWPDKELLLQEHAAAIEGKRLEFLERKAERRREAESEGLTPDMED